MSSGYLDLFIEQGEDFSANISLTALNSASYNLSSYSVRSDIRRSYWSEDATASFTTELIDGGNDGEISISLDSETTQSLTASKYVYDVFLINNSSNSKSKILQGTVYVDPSSTKF